jgi:hypothetical protein
MGDKDIPATTLYELLYHVGAEESVATRNDNAPIFDVGHDKTIVLYID